MSPRRNNPPDGILHRSKVWRYMSVPKFISLLSKKELHFCRIDRLDDQLEGMLSPRTIDAYAAALLANEQIQSLLSGRPGIDDDEVARLTIGTSDMMLRAKTFVNCWYLSEVESTAMWQTYGKDGIAIQSTWKRLTEAMDNDVFVGQVQYVDRQTDFVHIRVPFLYKDKIFEGEREIRLMVRRVPKEASFLEFDPNHRAGVSIPVNLDRLIKRIYVAPRSGAWFKEVIEDLLVKFDLPQKRVLVSAADYLPEYRRMFEETRAELLRRAYPLALYEDDFPEDDPWGLQAAETASEGR